MSIVQSLWVGTTLHEMQQLSIRSFLAHGHQYHLYAYGELDGLPEGATLCDASAILPRDSIFCYQNGFGKGSYSAFSNVFRYKLLLDRGGWWVDTDVACLKPFSFEEPFVIATEYDYDHSIKCATSVLKAPAGSPLLQYCLDTATAKDKQQLKWSEIGPILLDDAVKRFDLVHHRVAVDVFSPINYFEYPKITESGFDMACVAQSHAVHLWNQMWKTRSLDPSTNASADSLYGWLKRSYVASA